MYDGAISPEKAVRVLMKNEFDRRYIYNNKYVKSRTIKCYCNNYDLIKTLRAAVEELMDQYGIPVGKDGYVIKTYPRRFNNSFIVSFAYPVLKG